MKFKDKVAFITGGARGIGFVFAKAFAAEGAAVVLADISAEAAASAAADIVKSGGKAAGVQCDASDEASVKAAVAVAIGKFGGIDILVNNAGKHLMQYTVPLLELPLDKWRGILDLNVLGLIICAKACRDSMRSRGGGSVINIASISAWYYHTPYSISKLAVRALTAGLSQELGPDSIRVNCISPGVMDSDAAMTEMPEEMRMEFINRNQVVKRQGRMTDLVGALFYFCSEESSFVTGENINVSGGFPARI